MSLDETSQEQQVRKNAKYAVMGRRFILQPASIATSGAMRKSTIQFTNDLGRRLVEIPQDSCESNFLFQGMSLAIMKMKMKNENV